MKFAALGRTSMLYDAVEACTNQGHECVLVGTCPAAPEYTRDEKDFEELARELSCPFFCDPAIGKPEYVGMMRDSGAEVAVSMNWLTVMGSEVLHLFRHGVVNAHAGDLPRYRGNACPNWAIINGEDRVVLTLHLMREELDAGPILLQRSFPLSEKTYIGDFYRFMETAVPGMFAEVLDGLENQGITPRPQPADPALSLRCFPRRPEDSRLDFRLDAGYLCRLVRAGSVPFSGAYADFEGERLIVWRARAGELDYPWLGVPGQVAEIRRDTGEVAVLTGKGVLILEEVERQDNGRVSPAQVIRSTRTRLG
ncbi:MAG: methionyl-tRNA formyltransferase [Desulfatibacillaceae bacterium]